MNIFLFIIFASIVDTILEPQVPLLDVDQQRVHKEKFYALFEAKIVEDELSNPNKKRKKTRAVTKLDEYEEMIKMIEDALVKNKGRTQKEYYLINKYQILVVGDTKKIILKRESVDEAIRFLVPYEHLFETIYKIHIQVGHKCRDIMIQTCNKNHLNITVEMITGIFLILID